MSGEVSAAGRDARAGRVFWLAAACLALLQLLLLNHFVPLAVVLGPQPIQGVDFDLHIGQVWRVTEGLERWGQSWVYDVKLLAGQPEGTITDAGSKGWELWTYAVHALGLSKAVAFNSFVWILSALCPWIVLASARVFGLGAWASLLAAAMATSLWFFDSFVHWAWWVGMISYSGVSFLTLFALACFWRYLEQRKTTMAILCGLSMAIAHVIHPYSFFVLAPPMAALYARAFPRMSKAGHATVGALGLFTLVVNAYWLHAAYLHWHYVLNSAYFGQASARFFVSDFFEVLLSPTDTGVIGTRTGFRFLYFGLAVAGLGMWQRARDRRFLPFCVALVALFAFAYLGSSIPFAEQVQPYRHIIPACLFSTIPAAALVERLWRERTGLLPSFQQRAAGFVLVMVIAQHLSGEVLYFLPRLVPEPARLSDGFLSPITKYGGVATFWKHTHVDYVLPHAQWIEPGHDELVRWVRRHVAPGERVLADNSVLGERLAWKTDAEVLGGFRERNVKHAYANFFRRYGTAYVSDTELGSYLQTFAVRWVITQTERADFSRASHLLERLPNVANNFLYRVKTPTSTVLQGGGVARARTNRIVVQGSNPNEALLLAYHFHEALRCEPSCKIERAEVPLDEVGFIRIPAPHPADLAIVNRYQF